MHQTNLVIRLLGRARFIIWYKTVHGLTHAQASAKWVRDFANPQVAREVENGETCLWVREDTRIESVDEVGKRRSVFS
jgi:hypothetical protein